MEQFKILVLTDHTGHSSENSLYPLSRAMHQHAWCQQIDVATQWNSLNDLFFQGLSKVNLLVNPVDQHFAFHEEGRAFKRELRKAKLEEYDLIWLRLPPPIPKVFLDFLQRELPDSLIINDPKGIWETGTKRFLLRFPDICPPLQYCTSMADIIAFKDRFPIVLKPVRAYGGKGLVKIDGDRVWVENRAISFQAFQAEMAHSTIAYLGVEYLHNVSLGDKRIVVVDGQTMGASLRLPPKDSWICNVASGGSSHLTAIDDDEREIIKQINPVLAEMGIVMYGIDTLVGNDGKRVLSEINTTSIGGLPQIGKLQGTSVVQQAVHLILNYIKHKKQGTNVIGNR